MQNCNKCTFDLIAPKSFPKNVLIALRDMLLLIQPYTFNHTQSARIKRLHSGIRNLWQFILIWRGSFFIGNY